MDVEMDKSGIGRRCRRLLRHGCERSLELEGCGDREGRLAPQWWCLRPGLSTRNRQTATKRPRFPAAADPTQSWGMSCAQTAIIPTKSVMDASAAASSTNIFNMPASRFGT
jgi:hypothetical protein